MRGSIDSNHLPQINNDNNEYVGFQFEPAIDNEQQLRNTGPIHIDLHMSSVNFDDSREEEGDISPVEE